MKECIICKTETKNKQKNIPCCSKECREKLTEQRRAFRKAQKAKQF